MRKWYKTVRITQGAQNWSSTYSSILHTNDRVGARIKEDGHNLHIIYWGELKKIERVPDESKST